MEKKRFEAMDSNRIGIQLAVSNSFLGIGEGDQIRNLELSALQSAADLQPQDQDFIYANFRALSKSYIPLIYTDFSKDDVLQQSVPLLKGQTVYPDHLHRVEAWLGVVTDSVWDETLRPDAPGINTTWKIDALANPKIARGLMMRPPALHSSSVYVVYSYEMSHPDMKPYQFWDMIGEEVDGRIVCLVANQILAYYEHSLVWQGADSSSKSITDPQEQMQQLKKEMKSRLEKPSTVFISDPAKEAAAVLTKSMEDSVENEIIAAVGTIKVLRKETLALLGIEEEDPTFDRIEAAILSLTEKNAVLAKENQQLAAEAENGRAYLADLRADALRLAAIVEAPGGKMKESLLKLIAGASLEQARDLVSMYQAKADAMFPEKCQACGSTEVVRRSSIEQLGSAETLSVSRPEQFSLRR